MRPLKGRLNLPQGAELRTPIIINGVTRHCTASVGVALFGAHAITAEGTAHRQTLPSGQGRWQKYRAVFDPDAVAVLERIALERELEDAIGQKQPVHYQPQDKR